MNQNIFIWGLLAIAVVVLVIPAMGSPSFSASVIPSDDGPPNLTLHAMNPEFASYLEKGSPETLAGYVRELLDRGWGYIPPPSDLAYLRGRAIFASEKSFPAQYDLRDEGRVTPVKSQGLCKADWAFAAYSALESCLLPEFSGDLSEDDLKTMHGFDLHPCTGGNELMATAYITRGDGPLAERSGPYLPLFAWTAPQRDTPGNISVTEVLMLPDRNGPLDNENLKWAVTRYGAVYTTMYWEQSYIPFLDPYYSSMAESYSCQQQGLPSNHAVTIVGWDDTYDRNNFKEKPPGDGAFIVKNTWGPLFGRDGYVYVSYYDAGIGKHNAVFAAEPGRGYTSVYQYDPLGWTGTLQLGNGTSKAWSANIFTAKDAQPLSAVGFYTSGMDTEYRVFVHLDPDNGPINQSGQIRSRSGIFQLPGYHTIPLDPVIPLHAGQRFAIVVSAQAAGAPTGIPVEIPLPMYSSEATANAGESYVSSDGRNWVDVITRYPGSNVCIKAFTGSGWKGTGLSGSEDTSSPTFSVRPKAKVLVVPITTVPTPPPLEQTTVPTIAPTPQPTSRSAQSVINRPQQPAIPPTPAPTNTTVPETPSIPTLTPTPETPPPPDTTPDNPQPPEDEPTKKIPKGREKKWDEERVREFFWELVTEINESIENTTVAASQTPSPSEPVITETPAVPPAEETEVDEVQSDDRGDDGERDDDKGRDRED